MLVKNGARTKFTSGAAHMTRLLQAMKAKA